MFRPAILLVLATAVPAAAADRAPAVETGPSPALGYDWDDGREWASPLQEPQLWPRADLAAAGLADMTHDERVAGCADRLEVACADVPADRHGLGRLARVAGGQIMAPPLTLHFGRHRRD